MAEQKAAQQQPQQQKQPSLSLIARLGDRLGVDPTKLLETLKKTAFRQREQDAREPTNEEMMALLVIADQYKLNPFTRELYAFFDKKAGGIVPIVSVDGWLRIINEQPQLRSIAFRYSEETKQHKQRTVHEWIECVMKRSDRDDPVVIREYFDEVVRAMSFPTPWDTHPNRMHRHKVLIQCARVAFGFGGIHDPDEAERIIEGSATRVMDPEVVSELNKQLTHQPVQGVPTHIPKGNGEAAAQRRADAAEAAAAASRKAEEAQGEFVSFAQVADALRKADTPEAFEEAQDLIRDVRDPAQQEELRALVKQIEAGTA